MCTSGSRCGVQSFNRHFFWRYGSTGAGSLHKRAGESCTTLNIPAPALSAHFVSGLEFVGGVLLIVGLGSRITGLLLSGNMLVAYWAADREALFSIFSDPGKFYVADPYTFLFASVMVLVFGAGAISLDALLAKCLDAKAGKDSREYPTRQESMNRECDLKQL